MKIAILSRNGNLYSTKRLIEAAKKRKHEVRLVNTLKCDIQIEEKEALYHLPG